MGNVLWSVQTKDDKLIVANEKTPRGHPARKYLDASGKPLEQDELPPSSGGLPLPDVSRAMEPLRGALPRRVVSAHAPLELRRLWSLDGLVVGTSRSGGAEKDSSYPRSSSLLTWVV